MGEASIGTNLMNNEKSSAPPKLLLGVSGLEQIVIRTNGGCCRDLCIIAKLGFLEHGNGHFNEPVRRRHMIGTDPVVARTLSGTCPLRAATWLRGVGDVDTDRSSLANADERVMEITKSENSTPRFDVPRGEGGCSSSSNLVAALFFGHYVAADRSC